MIPTYDGKDLIIIACPPQIPSLDQRIPAYPNTAVPPQRSEGESSVAALRLFRRWKPVGN